MHKKYKISSLKFQMVTLVELTDQVGDSHSVPSVTQTAPLCWTWGRTLASLVELANLVGDIASGAWVCCLISDFNQSLWHIVRAKSSSPRKLATRQFLPIAHPFSNWLASFWVNFWQGLVYVGDHWVPFCYAQCLMLHCLLFFDLFLYVCVSSAP